MGQTNQYLLGNQQNLLVQRNRSYLQICNQFLDHYGAPLTSRCVSVSAVFREPCPRPEGQNVPSTRSISAERPSTAADGRAASPDMERGIQYPCTVHHYVMLRVNMWSAMGSQSMGNFSIFLCCLVRLGRQWSPLDIFPNGRKMWIEETRCRLEAGKLVRLLFLSPLARTTSHSFENTQKLTAPS